MWWLLMGEKDCGDLILLLWNHILFWYWIVISHQDLGEIDYCALFLQIYWRNKKTLRNVNVKHRKCLKESQGRFVSVLTAVIPQEQLNNVCWCFTTLRTKSIACSFTQKKKQLSLTNSQWYKRIRKHFVTCCYRQIINIGIVTFEP